MNRYIVVDQNRSEHVVIASGYFMDEHNNLSFEDKNGDIYASFLNWVRVYLGEKYDEKDVEP